jgi:hypothetical protein
VELASLRFHFNVNPKYSTGTGFEPYQLKSSVCS